MRTSLPAVTGLGPVERTFHELFQPQTALGRLAGQVAVRGGRSPVNLASAPPRASRRPGVRVGVPPSSIT